MKKISYVFLLACCFLACDQSPIEETTIDRSLYFPPNDGISWETIDPNSLDWQIDQIPNLLDYLAANNTRAFLVLKDGRIAMEAYFGNNLSNQPFSAKSNWYWASAGKSLKAFVVGQAQTDGFLNIEDKSSDYLGDNWTSLTIEQERAITIQHQLSMTTGLDDGVADIFCTSPSCLTYLAEPNNRWAYHNGPYTVLEKVVGKAVNDSFENYFNSALRDPIAMDGFWRYTGDNHIYYSTPRAMAKFGLLIANNGDWENESILKDKAYLNDMLNTSQLMNPSYGYLWWLNGKSTIMVPTSQIVFNRSLSAAAPEDMIAAMGKNGQLLNIVPSQGLVIVRMGESPDNSLVPFDLQEQIWERLNLIIK